MLGPSSVDEATNRNIGETFVELWVRYDAGHCEKVTAEVQLAISHERESLGTKGQSG